ncbi:MAG: AMP-binding protein [Clostridia bacterium]|nr:AMP-binding protein [Clostridia bacterium]
MIELLARSFAQNAERPAYRAAETTLTFAQLWQLAARYAADLAGSRAPVLLIGDKEPHMLAGILACLMAGRPYVPCDRSLPPARLAAIRAQSGAADVIDGTTTPARTPLTAFAGTNADLAYILFTSGSTGVPKGVPITRGNLKAFVQRMLLRQDALTACAGGTILNHARLSFDLSDADVYFALCTGTAFRPLTAQELSGHAALLPALVQANPDAAVMTPSFARHCLLMPEFSAAQLPRLRCIFFCGEPLTPAVAAKLFARFPGLRILNAYGPTEATCAVCASEITPEMTAWPRLPCGDPAQASCEIRIENGEIVLAGASVFGGYLGDPAPVTVCRTGDGGEIRDGRLFCTGRLSGYVKLGGFRIEPAEVRLAIEAIPGVEACTVTTVRRGETVLRLRAAVLSETRTAAEIRAALAERLPAYMIPAELRVQASPSVSENCKLRL